MRKSAGVIDRAVGVAGNFLSSKYAIILFALLPLAALSQTIVAAVRGDIASLIGWLSQDFIQLVSLPLLAYLTKSEGTRVEARDQETHDAVMQEHEETQQILANLTRLIEGK